MRERGRERILHGTPASGGLALGAIVRGETSADPAGRAIGTPEEEAGALEEALARAGAELDALIEGEDELAAGILEFQRALLDDETLVDPIRAAARGGAAAHTAWTAALDREAAEYRAGDDPEFAARSEDLVDLRDRVLAALGPGGEGSRTLRRNGLWVGRDLTPSKFLSLDRTALRGVALGEGSRTSHVAILARARGVPLVVGLEGLENGIEDGAPAVLDAEMGRLIVSPSPATVVWARRREASIAGAQRDTADILRRPAATAGGEPVAVLVNADLPDSLDTVSPDHCDGIGLVRTEFLFPGHERADEEAQLAVYRRFLGWAEGRPVTIRTLDAGGDKPIPGLTVDGEANPFLGMRGLRLSLASPGAFRVQLRALARAAAAGPLRVMVPMVTVPEEVERVRDLLDTVVAELAVAGVAHARPALGMMVEVPAAALEAAAFDVAFYSIGSNDLVQYVTASARDNPAVARLANPRRPAVLRLIREVAAVGRAKGVEVSLCGDIASEPELIPDLLAAGLRSFSVAPAALGRVKAAIAAWPGG